MKKRGEIACVVLLGLDDSFAVDLECFSCADRNGYVLANTIKCYVKHSILVPNAPLLWILLLGSRFSTHFTTKTYTLSRKQMSLMQKELTILVNNFENPVTLDRKEIDFVNARDITDCQ